MGDNTLYSTLLFGIHTTYVLYTDGKAKDEGAVGIDDNESEDGIDEDEGRGE